MDGKIPSNFYEGFMSGLGHPILGLDHFAFVISCGVLGVAIAQGVWLAPSFVVGTLAGLGIHVATLDLPVAELIIASSVVVFGALIIFIGWQKNGETIIPSLAILGGGALAGIFHGYAYGEFIVGAEMSPLFAYFMGVAVVQLATGVGIFWIFSQLQQRFKSQYFFALRFMGGAIAAVGMVFLTA